MAVQDIDSCIFLLIYVTYGTENLVFLNSATYNTRVVNSNLLRWKYQPMVLFRAVFLPTVLVYFSWHYIYSPMFLRHFLQKGWKQNKEIKQHYPLRRQLLCSPYLLSREQSGFKRRATITQMEGLHLMSYLKRPRVLKEHRPFVCTWPKPKLCSNPLAKNSALFWHWM